MKKLLLLVFLLPLSVSAQHEFGYHATWHYGFSEFGFWGYRKVTHVGDTAMMGMNWLKFEVSGAKGITTGPGPNDFNVDTNHRWSPIYLATRNDSVFRLLNDSTPYLLYDFSAQVGDQWQFAPLDTSTDCDSVPIARVISKGTEIIDGQKVEYLDLGFPMDTVYYDTVGVYQAVSGRTLSHRIYRAFGSLEYTVLFQPFYNDCRGLFLTTNWQLMRCFSNDSISLGKACDFVPYISLEEHKPISFEVFPNPTNALVNIHSEEEVARVEVYSLDGQKLIETSQTENIELPASSGMYVVAIYFEDGRRVVTKVVRE